MFEAIGGAVASLKTASEIANSFLGLRDTALIQGRVIELQSIILSAQGNALAAQSEQFMLLEQKRDLEEKISHLQAWDNERTRYQLEGVGSGCFVYSLRSEAGGSEPLHKLCASCFQHRRKSILQRFVYAAGRAEVLQCHECKSEVVVHGIVREVPR